MTEQRRNRATWDMRKRPRGLRKGEGGIERLTYENRRGRLMWETQPARERIAWGLVVLAFLATVFFGMMVIFAAR